MSYRITAATDFSAHARHAAERAALIASERAAVVDLVHVVHLGPLERLRELLLAENEDLTAQVTQAAQARMDGLADMLLTRRGVPACTRIRVGAVLAELIAAFEEVRPSLVVCGDRGERALRQTLLGSTAEKLLSRAPCPVLVVKQPARDRYRTVLVSVDFSAASLRAIHHAIEIAPAADLVLLHVFEVPFEGQLRYASVDESRIQHYRDIARADAIERLQVLARQAGLEPQAVRMLVVNGDPFLRIAEMEQEHDSDQRVLGKRAKGAVEAALLGSVSRQVVAQSQGDVLVSVEP